MFKTKESIKILDICHLALIVLAVICRYSFFKATNDNEDESQTAASHEQN